LINAMDKDLRSKLLLLFPLNTPGTQTPAAAAAPARVQSADDYSTDKILKTLQHHHISGVQDILSKVDDDFRNVLLFKAKEDFYKRRRDEKKRLEEQALMLNYLTRAERVEESKIISRNYELLVGREKEEYDAKMAAFVEEARKQHELDRSERDKYAHLQELRTSFESKIRAAEYSAQVSALRHELLLQRWSGKVSVARKLLQEKLAAERAEAERQAKLEVERQARLRAEEQARLRAQEEEAERLRVESEKKNAKYVAPAARKLQPQVQAPAATLPQAEAASFASSAAAAEHGPWVRGTAAAPAASAAPVAVPAPPAPAEAEGRWAKVSSAFADKPSVAPFGARRDSGGVGASKPSETKPPPFGASRSFAVNRDPPVEDKWKKQSGDDRRDDRRYDFRMRRHDYYFLLC
jgi:hypothetical protein